MKSLNNKKSVLTLKKKEKKIPRKLGLIKNGGVKFHQDFKITDEEFRQADLKFKIIYGNERPRSF